MDEETLNPEPGTVTSPENNNGDQPMLDIADQNPNSSSSDSDSGSEEEDPAQQNLQLQTLEDELATNPANYDAHVQVSIHTRESSLALEMLPNKPEL